MSSVAAGSPDYRVQLEFFEGPLDLLLHLIRTQEIDIYDIPIARITEQYLQYLQMMRDLSITVAGEFVLMAATLIHIKSKMLLPPDPVSEEGEEPEDPRRELVDRLLEHERFRKAAGMLHDRQVIEDSVWARGEKEFEDEEQEAVSVSLFDLIQAFHRIIERYKDQIVIQVQHDNVSLEDKLDELRALMAVRKDLLFSFFLQHPLSRVHLIVTFFALLEMARLHEVRLFQETLFDDIRIVAC
jgi:segregation and condensation protein A